MRLRQQCICANDVVGADGLTVQAGVMLPAGFCFSKDTSPAVLDSLRSHGILDETSEDTAVVYEGEPKKEAASQVFSEPRKRGRPRKN